MKLISCYIENFGGLQQHTVNFREGITVIEAPNGFGKTTLAEFIRAMFYGFPRANKDLQKNPRQKYLPWQGGKYGGWLLFEHGGHRYRMERTFGEKPAQDKFKLIDEDTGRESAAYTANIGEELFGIDADAFQRSTYLPQSHEGGPLSTDSIRAKLGNLLEDTGDMSGYEKALTRLQDRRKQYELYRGTGGSIYKAKQQMTALQQDIRAGEARRPELEEIRRDMDNLLTRQSAAEAELQTIRTHISAAARLQADAALSRQYEALTGRMEDLEGQIKALEAQYPKGMPSEADLQEAGAHLDRIALLRGSLPETETDRTAANTLQQLQPMFTEGLPSDELLEQGDALYRDSLTLQAGITAAVLPDTDRQLLEKLEAQFAPGVPEDSWFEELQQDCSVRKALQHRQAELTLSPPEKAHLQELEQFFAPGVPTPDALSARSRTWEQAQSLRQDAALVEATIVPAAAPAAQPKPFHGGFFPALILALLAGSFGGALLAMQDMLLSIFTTPQPAALRPALDYITANRTLVAGISLGIAALLLVVAIILQVMQSLRNDMARNAIAAAQLQDRQQARADALREDAASLEEEVVAFLRPYAMADHLSPTAQLRELADRADTLTRLQSRKVQLTAAAAEAAQDIQKLENSISLRLQPYKLLQTFGDGVATLRSRRDRYISLVDMRRQTEETARTLQNQLDGVSTRLARLLQPYYGTVTPADFHSRLTALRRDRDRFTAARAQIAARRQALERRDAQIAEQTDALHTFSAKYALPAPTKALLETLRDHLRMHNHLQMEQAAAQADLADFCTLHGPRPASDLPEVLPDMEALKAAEQQCFRQHNQHADALAHLKRREQQVLDALDTLPALQDELQRVTEQMAADSHSRDLLDKTAALLQQSRESLSNRYLGGVQSHFTRYLTRLTGEPASAVRMNADLEVLLERSGEARPLEHFSAGQSDMIGLCMRLALADALFEGEPCFMILDDPFVNLDDSHTAQALELLRELSADRQFIYLVCHSSRAV